MKLKINTDGFEGYAKRALERARKLDRREAIKPEITITFEDPLAMVEVLTAERLRLVQKVRTKSSSITALAAALKRDPKSVRRDVLKLERAGVVRTRATDQSRPRTRENRGTCGPRIPPHCGSLTWQPPVLRQIEMPVATVEDDAFNRSECRGIFTFTSAERGCFRGRAITGTRLASTAFTPLGR